MLIRRQTCESGTKRPSPKAKGVRVHRHASVDIEQDLNDIDSVDSVIDIVTQTRLSQSSDIK
jgi:hypothetical protein